MQEEGIANVLSPAGMTKYGRMLQYLIAEVSDLSELQQQATPLSASLGG